MLSLHVITIMMVIMGCRGYPGQCSSIRGGDGIPLHVMGMHMDHRGCRASEGVLRASRWVHLRVQKGSGDLRALFWGCVPDTTQYPDPPLPNDMGS